MSGGFALVFISFFFAISSFVVALLFIHSARVMDAILADPFPLAHWTYPEETVRASAEREFRNYEEQNRAMFIVIGGMLLVASLFFIIFVREGGLMTGIVLLAFTVFLFVISRVAPALERRRAIRAPREAFISRNGIIYEGAVYPFRSFLMHRDGITFRKADKKGPAAIIFSYTQIVGYFIVRPFDIIVPVPPGQEKPAERIIIELRGAVPEQ